MSGFKIGDEVYIAQCVFSRCEVKADTGTGELSGYVDLDPIDEKELYAIGSKSEAIEGLIDKLNNLKGETT